MHEDAETGQTLISGMGELHLEVAVERLRREYDVQASVGKPQVVFRETIQAEARGESTFARKLKEAELFGQASCVVRPLPRGSGIKTEAALDDPTTTPPAIMGSALEGLTDAAQSGPDGYPMQDLEATLLSVAYREEAQPEVGVRVAAGDAFRKAVAAASPLRLEPVMSVEVTVQEEYLGAVIGDLKKRRAQIQEIGHRGDARVIDALVPLRLMFGYSTDLRSLTKGRANFTLEFHSFDNLSVQAP